MRLGALALQATLVVAVTATVGYPEFRQPARTLTIWRPAGPLTPQPGLVAGDPRFMYGVTNASLPRSGALDGRQADALGAARPERQGSRDASTTRRTNPITGRARTALNQPVPFASVALRNIRTGRIESRTRADQAGGFDFDMFAPGSYVVEILGADGSVIAASELLDAPALTDGMVVRVSGNATPRALFGAASPLLASTASEPLGRAADAGMRQTTLPGAEASPRN